MALFGKKKETAPEVLVTSRVKVLGSGCDKCNQLEASVKTALQELGADTAIGHVKDFSKIAEYGVMTTPALVYDNEVLSYGRVLSKEEAKTLLEGVLKDEKGTE